MWNEPSSLRYLSLFLSSEYISNLKLAAIEDFAFFASKLNKILNDTNIKHFAEILSETHNTRNSS